MASEHMQFGITIRMPDGTTMNVSDHLIGLEDRKKELEQELSQARALLEKAFPILQHTSILVSVSEIVRDQADALVEEIRVALGQQEE